MSAATVHAVKITSGEARGRKIATPGSSKTHPMGERERLALFNSLGPRLKDATILDLYAGSGALGLEALSRGAKNVIFIEQDKKAADCILKNARKLGYEDKVIIIKGKVQTVLKNNGLPEKAFDIILCDPPYDHFDSEEFSADIAGYLNENGAFVLSHPGEVPPELPGLKLLSTKKYAAAHLSFYAKA